MELLFCYDNLKDTQQEQFRTKRFVAASAMELIPDQFTNVDKRYAECTYISTPILIVQDDFTRFKTRQNYLGTYIRTNRLTVSTPGYFTYKEKNIFSSSQRGETGLAHMYFSGTGPMFNTGRFLSTYEMCYIVGDSEREESSFDYLVAQVTRGIGETEQFIGRIEDRDKELYGSILAYAPVKIHQDWEKKTQLKHVVNTGLLFSLVVNDIAKTEDEAYRFGVELGVLSSVMEISREAVRSACRMERKNYGYVESKIAFQLLFVEYDSDNNHYLKEQLIRGVDDGIKTTFAGHDVCSSIGKHRMCTNYYIK